MSRPLASIRLSAICVLIVLFFGFAGSAWAAAPDPTKTCFVTPGATATTSACITTATNVLGASKTFEVVVDDTKGPGANNPVGSFQFYVDGVLVGYKTATADSGGGTISSRATFTLSTLMVGSRSLTATFVPTNAANYDTSCAGGGTCTSSGLTDTVTARTSSATLSALATVTVRTSQTPTITVTDQAGATGGTFTSSASYAITPRSGHTARLLPDGRIFVFGGQAGGVLLANGGAQMISTAGTASAETPTTGTFTAVTDGTATVLQDGTILLAGGSDGTNALATAYIYDPIAKSVTATTGNLQTARKNHAATLLTNGKVLITGGTDSAGTALATPNMVEIYDPAAGTFAKVTGDMAVARAGHTATLLRTGTNAGAVLLAGGGDASFEIYTVTGATTGSSSGTSPWTGAASDHTATSLADGNILLAGGGAAGTTSDWLYDVVNNTIVDVTTSAHPLATGRTGHTATQLSDGTVVLIGGLDATSTEIGTAEIYAPSYGPQGPVTMASSPVDATNLTLTGCTLALSGTGATSCTGTVDPVHFGSASYSITASYAATTNHGSSTTAPQTLNVNKKAITVTALADTKMYDSTIAGVATPATPVGLAGDTITVAQDFNSKDVATASFSIPRVVSILDGASADVSGDYAVTLTNSAPASSSITKRNITVTATAGTKMYGASDPALAFTVGGSGYAGAETAADAFTGNLTRAAGETVAGGPYAISNGTLAATANYSYTSGTDFTGANFTITARPITVIATAGTKHYGDVDPALTFTVGGSGYAFAETAADAFTGALARAAGETIAGGPYAISNGTLAATSNYSYNSGTDFTGANFTITQRPITVIATAQSKMYGTSDPVLTFTVGASGYAPGETAVDAFTGALARAAGETVAGSPYAISNGTLAATANYSYTSATDFTAANLTITKRPITVIADPQTKTYGNSDPAFTFTVGGSGYAPGETAADAFTGSLGRVAGENVATSPYAITNGTLAATNNYSYTSGTDFTTANLTITKRAITVIATAQSKIYGATDPALAFTVGGSGYAPGENAAIAFTGSLTRVAGETVAGSPYAISNGTLAATSNYSYTSGTDFTAANLTINQRPITVIATAQSKMYGASDPALTFTVGGSGYAPGENAAIAFTGSLTRVAGETVASSPYAISNGTLAATANYSYNSGTDFTAANLTITKRPITVIATAQSKTYGDNDPALTYTVGGSGFAPGETAVDAFTGALTRVAGETVGSSPYAISNGTLAATNNYSYTSGTDFTGANLTITKRPVTVTANPQTKVYGDNDPALTYGDSGLANNPGISVVDTQGTAFTGGLARATGETVAGGPYAIGQGTLASANYTITYNSANLSITARPITVTVDAAQTKVYGNTDPTLTFTVGGSGLANNPGISVVDTQASAFTGAISRVAGETVAGGPYAISQNTLAANSNYSLGSFTGSTFTITARPITVTVDAAQTKVYGNIDPTLTFTVGGSGLANNPGISIVDSNATVFTGTIIRAAGENVGSTYAITQNTLAANSNYNLTSFTGANFSITQRPVTVTADAGQTKVYGTADPGAFTYSITSGTLAFSDAFSGALSRAAGESVATYAIGQNTLTLGSNYNLTYVGANFAITQRPVTITANSGQTKIYGTADPVFTYGITSGTLAFSDTFSGVLARAAGETVGSYAIGQGSVTLGANYNLTYVGANFTITQATSSTVLSPTTAANYDVPVTFTATVTSGTTGVPTGTVNFFDGATLLGSGALNGSGVATYTSTTSSTTAVAQLAAGSHTITAVYTGDTNFSASPTSPAVTQTINKTAASTVVSPTTAAAYDVAVTFTATVTSATTGVPTGTVDFFDGATKIGTGTLNASGVATYTSTTSATTAVAQLAAGSHPITAVYNGDSNFNASPASPSVTQTINKAGTTSVVTTTAASVYNVAVTFTATVTSATTGVPTGTVNFFDGATLIGSGALDASGVATYTTTTSATTAVAQLAAGSHPITAVYTGDSNFNVSPASATMTHTVNKAGVSALVSPTTPADYDVPVTFTATVASATTGVPTGTVDFFDGASKIGTGTLNASGVATYTSTTSTTTTLAQLAVGSHPITAVYNGDANYSVSPASPAVAQVINKTSTTTVVTPTAASTYNVGVTFTATVTSATSGVPTGTVDFFDGTSKIGSGTLNATGVATYTTTTSATTTVAQLAAGAHTITAVYNGDANYGVSPASAAITHTVNQAGVTSVVTPTTPTNYNVAVTFTATVTSATTGIPTGTIDFFDGALKIGSGTLNASGVATYTTTTSATAAVAQLAAGAHPITAVYNGDANYSVSPASATMTHTVNQTVTSLSISSGTNPSIYGTTFVLNTTVTSATTGVPTGTVDFFEGTTKLGTGTVDATGAASYTTSAAQALSMQVGSHTLNAVYNGDANFLTVTSANLPQTVNKAATTSVLTTAANPNIFGTPLVITATVTSATTGVPTGTVTIFEQGVATPLATNVALVNGVAQYSTDNAQQQAMTNGHHILFFTYSGDANYVASTAPNFDESVGLAATASVITSPGASVFGEPVIFSVTVTAPGTNVIPVGTVDVLDGTQVLGTVTLDGTGKATYQTTLAQALAMAAGSHSITAKFNGNPNFVTSTSPVYTQAVNKAGSTTALSTQLSLNAVGNGVYTFTSTLNWVTSASTKGTPIGTAGIPSGTVNILDNGSVIVTNLPLVLNTTTGVSVATSAPIQLAAGQHKITINYNGDPNFLSIVSEASAPVSVLSLLNTSLQPSSTPYPQTLPVAYAGTGTVKLTTALDPCSSTSTGPCVSYNFATKLPAGFTAAEQVGCVVTSVNPVTAPPTCSIDAAGSHLPLTLSSASLAGAVVIKINTTTLTNVQMRPAPRPGSNRTLDLYGLTLGMPAIVFMGLAVPAGRRRRKVLRGSPMAWLGLILVVVILLGAIGCGGGSFNNPKNAQPVLTSGSTTAGTYTAVVYYTPQGCTTGSCAQAIASVDFSVVQ